eukprot:8021371-Pyramimonas_sp.AAC.1
MPTFPRLTSSAILAECFLEESEVPLRGAAMPPTPAKKSGAAGADGSSLQSGGDFSPAVLRLPTPKKEGNSNDAAASTVHNCLMEMVDGCLKDRSLIMPLYGKFQEHQRTRRQEEAIEGAPMLDKAETLACMDESAKVGVLMTNSDMTEDSVVKLAAKNDNYNELVSFALQIPSGRKLPKEFNNVEVWQSYRDERIAHCGNRLHRFVTRGGVQENGSINYMVVGCYSLDFDKEDGKLKTVKHFNGDLAEVPEETGI